MIRTFSIFRIALALIFGVAGLRGQSETVALISIDDGKPTRWALVAVTPDQNLKLRSLEEPSAPSARQAELAVPLSRITSVTIEPHATWGPLLAALTSDPTPGKISAATALAARYAQLANLPSSNGADLAFAACDALAAAGAKKECLQVLEEVFRFGGPDEKTRANLHRAQVLASEGNVSDAEALLAEIPQPKRSDPFFPIDRITRGRVAFLRGDYRTAIDLYAQAFARATPADSWLPESMYFLASCYVEIARDSDPMEEDTGFEEVGKMVFTDLVTLHPESPWARKARKEKEITPRSFSDKPDSPPAPGATPIKPEEKPAPQPSPSPIPEEKEIR